MGTRRAPIREVFDLSPLALGGAWTRSASGKETEFHRRLYRVAVMVMRGDEDHEHGRSAAEREELVLAHVDDVAAKLVQLGVISAREMSEALRRDALVLAARYFARNPGDAVAVARALERSPGFASRLDVHASELLSGSFPSELELKLLAGSLM